MMTDAETWGPEQVCCETCEDWTDDPEETLRHGRKSGRCERRGISVWHNDGACDEDDGCHSSLRQTEGIREAAHRQYTESW